jgi:hypothetical protein
LSGGNSTLMMLIINRLFLFIYFLINLILFLVYW